MKRIVSLVLVLALLCTAMVLPAFAEQSEQFVDTFEAADYSAFGFIKKIPMKPKYSEPTEEKGTVELLTYTCPAYDMDETVMVEKQLMVYTPYGYDPAQPYDILYLMHGGGEDEYYWLSPDRMGNATTAVIDLEIAKGECKPVIIVAPTNNYPWEGETKQNGQFWKEIRNDIVPFIESRYATYANGDVSEGNLQLTRNHRAFAGFSMGSAISHDDVMKHNIDYFGYIGSYSGGTFDLDGFKETMMSDEVKQWPILFWYNGNGSADFALESHVAVRDWALEAMADRLTDGVNYCWIIFKGGTHAYNCWLPHTYNALRVFFQD